MGRVVINVVCVLGCLGVIGCGATGPGKRSVAEPSPAHALPAEPTSFEPEAAPTFPAAIYAELFEKGRTWKLAGSSTRTGSGKSQPTPDGTWEGSCSVTRVKEFSWGVTSFIDCDSPDGLLEGWWMATPRGLFMTSEEPGVTDPTLEPCGSCARGGRVILEPSPAPLDVEETAPDDPKYRTRYTVRKQLEAWCSAVASSDEEGESSGEICIQAGKGFVSGGSSGSDVARGEGAHEHKFVVR